MNTKITATALVIAGTLALSACAPMPQHQQGPIPANPHINPLPPITNPGNQGNTGNTGNPGPATPVQQYVVQLTASNSASKAGNISNSFSTKGYNAFVSPLNINGQTLHRVQIGMFNSMEEAKAALAQMKAQHPGDTYLAGAIAKTP